MPGAGGEFLLYTEFDDSFERFFLKAVEVNHDKTI